MNKPSKAKKCFGFIFNDKERIDKYTRLYIHHRNLYHKGVSEFGFLRSLVSFQSLMITWLFFKDIFPGLGFWIFAVCAPFLVVFKTLAQWLLGYWWDRNDVYDKESDWGNHRDPITKVISKILLSGEGIYGKKE